MEQHREHHKPRESCASCASCELCAEAGGELLWADEHCRVVRVGGDEGRAFPGFCRVIWQSHVREMTDLDAGQRAHLMSVVFAVESLLRQHCQPAPDKINLASLGNLTPHVHWHVIPRWQDDSHFPAPIWAAANKTASRHAHRQIQPTIDSAVLRQALGKRLASS
ncbi:MAG: HIT family protein [Sterolibacterium sp.]|nr:HIT family protein [Sterolibacterium sp.]